MTDKHNRCPWCAIDIGAATGTCGKRACEIAQAEADLPKKAGEKLARALEGETKGRR